MNRLEWYWQKKLNYQQEEVMKDIDRYERYGKVRLIVQLDNESRKELEEEKSMK